VCEYRVHTTHAHAERTAVRIGAATQAGTAPNTGEGGPDAGDDASMSRILVCYGSTEGQTAAIADRIGDVLAEAGHDPLVISTKHPPPELDLRRYDGLIVAASVHMGHHQRHAASFVRSRVGRFNELPSAFVSVSLTAATGDEAATHTTAEYVETFLEETGWNPDRTHVVAGALRYRSYGRLLGFVMRVIAARAGLDTDTSRDHEYTDWAGVEAFAQEFRTLLEQEPTSSH